MNKIHYVITIEKNGVLYFYSYLIRDLKNNVHQIVWKKNIFNSRLIQEISVALSLHEFIGICDSEIVKVETDYENQTYKILHDNELK
jgi:hypothetical protein